MNCDRCNVTIENEEGQNHYGKLLCEDCSMDALSPPRPCDPWAVYTATSLEKSGGAQGITEIQEAILKLLGTAGGLEPPVLAARLNLRMPELEREVAALRHMEKVRGEMRQGKRMVCLW